jgi:ketosteroid isomerase-like protein
MRNVRIRPSHLAAAALGAGAAAALRAAELAATRAFLQRNVRALCAGDVEPLLSFYADDARMCFPGDHSWGREYRGRAEIEAFLRRFVAARLRGEIDAVLVQGPPWNTRIAIQFNDESRDPDGTLAYENRALILLRTRWGKIVEEELYEDTQKVAAFDEHLAARGELVAA